MIEEFDIVVAGVGGQGVLLLAEILGAAAFNEGHSVQVGEIHGMAQRGGSVVCGVRIGENVYAPIITDGMADVVVGLEPIETLRCISVAREQTLVLLSLEPVRPTSVITSLATYPKIDKILKSLQLFTRKIIPIDSGKLAKEAGAIRVQNIVMLGALAATGRLPIKAETLKEAIKELIPQKYVEVNLKAFELGYKFVSKKG